MDTFQLEYFDENSSSYPLIKIRPFKHVNLLGYPNASLERVVHAAEFFSVYAHFVFGKPMWFFPIWFQICFNVDRFHIETVFQCRPFRYARRIWYTINMLYGTSFNSSIQVWKLLQQNILLNSILSLITSGEQSFILWIFESALFSDHLYVKISKFQIIF